MAVSYRSGRLAVWDVEPWRLRWQKAVDTQISALALSHEGNRMAGGTISSDDNPLRLWDARDGTDLPAPKFGTPIIAATPSISSVSFATDGWLAAGQASQVILLDEAGTYIGNLDPGGRVRHLAFRLSTHFLQIATSYGNRDVVATWDADLAIKVRVKDARNVTDIALNARGWTLAFTTDYGKVRVWMLQ